MGYNATVVVLVDQLTAIENAPNFGKQLADAIRAKLSDPNENHIRAPYVAGQTTVIEAHHADGMMVIAVGGNCGQVLDTAAAIGPHPTK